MSQTLGTRFARALADKDASALRDVLADDVDFKALTPGRAWEASTPDEVVEIAFDHWFDESDVIVGDGASEADAVADTAHVSYRFDVDNPAGPHVVEQQAYYRATPDDARIGWMRIVCSGYRRR